jgi:hypothetical protein
MISDRIKEYFPKKVGTMKRFSIPFCVAIFLWSTSVFSQYRVSGIITDYIAAGPSKNCLVRLLGQSPNTITDSARSDATGNYAFANVTGGVYEIVMADSRYARDSLYATISRDTVFSFTVFALAHTLVEGTVPDTLTKAGSPYILAHSVQITKSLTITAGARIVLLRNAEMTIVGDVSAIGVPNDSIEFIGEYPGLDTFPLENHGSITLFKNLGNYDFAYCKFQHLNHISPEMYYPWHIGFENCRFSMMYCALLVSNSSNALNFSNNVVNCYQGIIAFGPTTIADSLTIISDNLFICPMGTFDLELGSQKLFLRRNTILGPTTIDMQINPTNDTIASNIFNDLIFSNATGKGVFFAYNDVVSLSGTAPLGIGGLSTVNKRGDSCDFFYNIKKKPLFADSTSGSLLKTSPCIATGLGGENIGVYQGIGPGAVREQRVQQAVQASFRVLSARRRASGIDLIVTFPSSDLARSGLTVYDLTGKRLQVHAQSMITDAPGAGPVTVRLSRSIAMGNYVLSIGSGNNRALARFMVTE